MFYVGVYRDQHLAQTCIANLQRCYRGSILSISDGVGVGDYEDFCRRNGVAYQEGQRLKLSQFSGRWTERFFNLFLETDDEWLVKVDPDTHVNQAATLPNAPIFCAYRYTHTGERILSGPAIGFSRETVERIIASGLLRDVKYTASKYAYHRFLPPLLKPWETRSEEAISLQDEITTDVAARLGIEPCEWSDVSFTDETAPFYHTR
jgi:hypothetical protein